MVGNEAGGEGKTLGQKQQHRQNARGEMERHKMKVTQHSLLGKRCLIWSGYSREGEVRQNRCRGGHVDLAGLPEG